jgi:hypothetical protein
MRGEDRSEKERRLLMWYEEGRKRVPERPSEERGRRSGGGRRDTGMREMLEEEEGEEKREREKEGGREGKREGGREGRRRKLPRNESRARRNVNSWDEKGKERKGERVGPLPRGEV